MYTMIDVKYTQEDFFMSAEFLDFILFHQNKCMNSYIKNMNIVIITMGN